MTDGLPTARTTLRTRYVRMLVFCNSCRHQADADVQALVDAGRGDVPLTELRFRCSNCDTDRMTSRDVVKPRSLKAPAAGRCGGPCGAISAGPTWFKGHVGVSVL